MGTSCSACHGGAFSKGQALAHIGIYSKPQVGTLENKVPGFVTSGNGTLSKHKKDEKGKTWLATLPYDEDALNKPNWGYITFNGNKYEVCSEPYSDEVSNFPRKMYIVVKVA